MYGLSLAGSGYLAPILAGFVVDGQGWKSVLVMNRRFENWYVRTRYSTGVLSHLPLGLFFLFFFMEETNYLRELSPGHEAEVNSVADPSADTPETNSKADENNITETDFSVSSIVATNHGKKSYWSTLKVFDTKILRYPNHLKGMILWPLIFLSFPVIIYSGFCYGSNLI